MIFSSMIIFSDYFLVLLLVFRSGFCFVNLDGIGMGAQCNRANRAIKLAGLSLRA